jgi:hypothetical protein
MNKNNIEYLPIEEQLVAIRKENAEIISLLKGASGTNNSFPLLTRMVPVKVVSEITGWSVNTILRKDLPKYKPDGKTAFYDIDELEQYLRKNRISSADEILCQASDYIKNNLDNKKILKKKEKNIIFANPKLTKIKI